MQQVDASLRCRLLEGFKELDEVADLIGFELELRHAGMAGRNSFAECLLKHLHGIAFMQGAERWSYPKRAWADFVDRMASCAIKLRQASALLDVCSLNTVHRARGDKQKQCPE